MSRPVYLQGKDDVKIVASASVATLGEPLQLTCESDHSENTTYTWAIYREGLIGQPTTPESRSGQILTLDPVSAEDEGLYTCTAQQLDRTFSTPSFFAITFSPLKAPGIQRTTSGLKPSDLFSLFCFCQGLFCDPLNPFRLYRDGARVQGIPYHDRVLFLSGFSITRTYDIDTSIAANSGNYTCTAINVYGESGPSRSISVLPAGLEIRNPSIVANIDAPVLGDDLVLTCQTLAAARNDQISWKKDDRDMFVTGRNLILDSLSEEDNGRYSCRVTDRDSFEDFSYQDFTSPYYTLPLRVPLMPELYLAPNKEFSPDSDDGIVYQKFSEGQNIFLRCGDSFTKVPPLSNLQVPGRSTSFYKDGQLVGSGDAEGIIQLSGLPKGEYNYTCVVNDRVGDSPMSWPLPVHVTDGPVVTSNPATIPANSIGLNIALTCEVPGRSDGYDIRWKKNGKTLPFVTTTLELNNLSQYDEGHYTCRQKIGQWAEPRSPPFTLIPLGAVSRPEIFTTQPETLEAGTQALTLHCLGISTTTTQATLFLQTSGSATPTRVTQSTEPSLDDGGQVMFTFVLDWLDATDTGDYTCTMVNGLGESEHSEPLTITVMERSECAGNPCQDNAECTDSVGGGYTCACLPGFGVNGSECTDMDECINNPCDEPQVCSNTAGSYVCVCPTGFSLVTPSLGCKDIDECEINPCQGNLECTNTVGAFSCGCATGFELNGTECKDIDECSDSPCHETQVCSNTAGSYNCSCPQGFISLAGSRCTAPFRRIFQVIFRNIQFGADFFQAGNVENAAVRERIRSQVLASFRRRVTGILDVLLTNLRPGSLIADMVVVIDQTRNDNPEGTYLKALSGLVDEPIEVNSNNSVTPELGVKDTDISGATMSQCELRALLEPCGANQVCQLDEDGASQCYRMAADNDKDKYIGLGVGLGAGLLILTAVVVFVCVRRQRTSAEIASTKLDDETFTP